jgi:glycosyltransferase involved in cell wall biosynthesis
MTQQILLHREGPQHLSHHADIAHTKTTGEKDLLSLTAVLIPTKNNELNIGSLVLLAKKHAGHVIVVDDNSHDHTVEIARDAGADIFPCGYTGGRINSILTGCRYALGYGCTVVVLLNSQVEQLTREIPLLAAPVLTGEADLVIGSRYLAGRKGITPYQFGSIDKPGHVPEENSLSSITDPTSTFRAFSIRAITLLDLLPDSDLFEPTMITLFSNKGLSVKEKPISVRKDETLRDTIDVPLYRNNRIAVVIPAHNEELLIGDTIAGIPDFVSRIYVVNDCSADRTQEVVEYYASRDSSVVPILHPVNKGPGAAITSGYKKALEDGMDIVVTMDGDNQMDPAFMTHLLDPIIDGKCDFCMGNRLINPEYRKDMSNWRFFGNSVLSFLTKISSGYWSMVDPQNGYTAISKRALREINIDKLYPSYGYLNDRLVKLNVLNFRVVNIPHPARYGMETSGIKYSRYIYRVSGLLFRDFLWRLKMKYVIYNFHPLVFFYAFGFFSVMVAFSGGLYAFYTRFFLGNSLFVPASTSLILLCLGFQSIFFAMFFDSQQEKGTNGWYL